MEESTDNMKHFTQQPPAVTNTLQTLIDALQAQFPWTPPRSDGSISKRVIALLQGTKTIERYVRNAIELKPYITPDYQALFVVKVEISDKALRYSVNLVVEQRKFYQSQAQTEATVGLWSLAAVQSVTIDTAINNVRSIVGGLLPVTESAKMYDDMIRDSLEALT